MGCWHGTCAVTNLHITHQDPIRMYILSRAVASDDTKHDLYDEDWGSGYTYVEDIWFPHFLPLKGKYDDYGGIENVEPGLNTVIVEHSLRKNLIERDVNDWTKIRREGSFKDFLHWLERGVLQVKGSLGPARLGLMMVHESAYQFVAGLAPAAHVLSVPEGLYGTYKTAYVDASSYVYSEALHDLDYRHSYMPSMRRLDPEAAEKYMVGTKTGPELDALKALTLEHVRFAYGMSALRKGFMPQAGKGSQDENDDEINAFATFTKSLVKEQRKRWKEYIG